MDVFSTLITQWYRQNSRDLPWRSTNDPYKIWLSEIILQQTKVNQGLNYYYKFIEQYPTVNDLAAATEDEVLKLWQGLGYYSRARNLRAAAQMIITNFDSVFPATFDEIKSLKGVGDYTAAAISSFAFNLPEAVVDGNVYRLLSRYYNISTPIDSARGRKEFKKLADELLDNENAALHNQAIMEVGAIVCTPKNPACQKCPLNSSCLALEKKTIFELPLKEKKTKVRERFFHYLIIIQDKKILLNKRGPNDIWQGLYDFPLIEETKSQEIPFVKDMFIGVKLQSEDGNFKHILSHQRIYAKFWICNSTEFSKLAESFIEVDIEDLGDYPMPQLLIRYLDSASLFKAD